MKGFNHQAVIDDKILEPDEGFSILDNKSRRMKEISTIEYFQRR